MEQHEMKNDMVEKNAILEIRSGSHLYGTSIPTSDEDKIGIFIAPEEYYVGLNRIEEVDLGVVSKGEDGKNLPDAIDRKFYEFRQFVNLAKAGNPNIIEVVMVNDENIINCSQFGQRIRDNADLFVSQAVRPKYIGYSIGQKKMMVNKPENFKQTVLAETLLRVYSESMTHQEFHRIRVAAKLNDMVKMGVCEDKLTHISIGKANYCTSTTLSKLHNMLKEKITNVTSRQDLWTKYGYDVKFASHLIRLLTEGIEVLTTGRIQFPLQNRDLLLSIRQGNFAKEEILEMADKLELELEDVHSDLPMVTDFDKVNAMLISTAKDFWASSI